MTDTFVTKRMCEEELPNGIKILLKSNQVSVDTFELFDCGCTPHILIHMRVRKRDIKFERFFIMWNGCKQLNLGFKNATGVFYKFMINVNCNEFLL